MAELPILPLAQLSEDMQQAMGQGRPLKMESDRAAKYQRMKHLMSFTDNADSIVFSHRMIKDAYEIAQLRKACRYTAEGINEMMRTLRLGMTEQEMENAMRESFLQQGADGVSFSQAASGANATSVHAGVTEHVLADGEMAVIDIGALCGPYTADISRSFPVNGTFTPQQRQIYEIVLKAQQLGMSYFLPGNNMLVGEEQAGNLIMRELYALGLVTDTTAVWQRNFYIQHGFGHHIGLDIHDVWYWFQRSIPKEERIYQPGMVLTFEPGIYFPANYLTSLPERYKDKVAPEELTAFIAAVEPIYNQYKGIGVRIEECVLITDDGQEILTQQSPINPVAIEGLMRN